MAKNQLKRKVLEYLYEMTFDILENHTTDDFSTDAFTMSIELNVDRANISRILNELWRRNDLIKVEGRPTYYLHRKCINVAFSEVYVPSVISKGDSLWNYLSGASKNNAIKDFNLIGMEPNQSLAKIVKELRIQLTYPFEVKTLLIYGEKNTGKSYLIDQMIQVFQRDAKDIVEIVAVDWQDVLFDKNNLTVELEKVENSLITKEYIVFQVNYFTDQNKELATFLYQKIANLVDQANKSKKVLIVLHSNECFSKNSYWYQNMEHTFYIDSFNQKTWQEKFEFVLTFIQNEADKLQMTIECPISIVDCLATSFYKNNLYSLKKEIQQTVSRSRFRSLENQEKIAKLNFLDLSDEVLNNIDQISESLSEIHTINQLLKEKNLFFIPDASLRGIEILKAQKLNEKGQILVVEESEVSVLTYAISKLKENNNEELPHYFKKDGQELYQLVEKVFPKLDKPSLQKIFGIIFELVEMIQTENYRARYYMVNYTSNDGDQESITQLISSIETLFAIQLPVIEKKLIRILIDLAMYGNSRNVSVLVVCHGKEIAEKYVAAIKNKKYPVICDYLNYGKADQQDDFRDFLQKVKEKLDNLDQGKGVIIVTDTAPLTKIAEMMPEQSVMNLSPISLPLLDKICQIVSRKDVTLDNAKELIGNHDGNQGQYYPSTEQGDDQAVLQILSGSLIFLDAKKAAHACKKVLQEILEDLNLNYTEEIMLRFVFHCSFMIERAIRNEPLGMKDYVNLIDKNRVIYLSLEKNTQVLNELFGIQIEKEEIARLCEIFVEILAEEKGVSNNDEISMERPNN